MNSHSPLMLEKKSRLHTYSELHLFKHFSTNINGRFMRFLVLIQQILISMAQLDRRGIIGGRGKSKHFNLSTGLQS